MNTSYNAEELNRIIMDRRSILPNMFTGGTVDDGIIRQILVNANWAPTHKKTEPWRFVVFKGEGLKKLAEFQSGVYKDVTTRAGDFREEKYNDLQTKPLRASHIIAICMRRDIKETVPEIEEIEAVACAVQNMYLTATAYGAGCYWGSGGITYMDEAKEFFGLGPKDKLLGFFYVGVPKKIPEGKRTPIEDKVIWVE